MDNFISENEAKGEIEKAETVLLKSFDRLLTLKHAGEKFEENVFNFQPELAECLYGLMTFYRKLKAEARDIISKKKLYSQDEFSELMARNKKFTDTVKKTIEIGKRLGDAFVWFFYQGNFSELEKHFQHESTGLFAIGVGGRGELEFIKTMPIINDCLVLYHGITSMLRIGDFSLYDFRLGIVGIGELKSSRTGDTLQVHAYVTLKKQKNIESSNCNPVNPQSSETHDLESNVIARLKKQLPAQRNALYNSNADMEISKIAHFEYDLINKLEQNDVVLNDSKSLLLLATRFKFNGLFEVLNEKADIMFPDSLRSKVEQMVLPNNLYNRMIVGSITTDMSYSRKPIMWWEIDDNVCRDLYFKKLHITTVFNPARMIQHYVDKGYSLVDSTDIRQIKLRKISGGYKSDFGNFEQLFDLVTHSLLKEEYAMAIPDQVISDIESGKYPPNSRIDMKTYLSNY